MSTTTLPTEAERAAYVAARWRQLDADFNAHAAQAVALVAADRAPVVDIKTREVLA